MLGTQFLPVLDLRWEPTVSRAWRLAIWRACVGEG